MSEFDCDHIIKYWDAFLERVRRAAAGTTGTPSWCGCVGQPHQQSAARCRRPHTPLPFLPANDCCMRPLQRAQCGAACKQPARVKHPSAPPPPPGPQGRLFIVMEFAAGGNLYEYVRAHPGPLPEDLVWRLAAQVGGAVGFGSGLYAQAVGCAGPVALLWRPRPKPCRPEQPCAARAPPRCCWACAPCTPPACCTATSRRQTSSWTRGSTRRSGTWGWPRLGGGGWGMRGWGPGEVGSVWGPGVGFGGGSLRPPPRPPLRPAQILSAQTAFAKSVVGTPYYLSPELCEDRPYNDKSDVRRRRSRGPGGGGRAAGAVVGPAAGGGRRARQRKGRGGSRTAQQRAEERPLHTHKPKRAHPHPNAPTHPPTHTHTHARVRPAPPPILPRSGRLA
jgi:serine/threonine protein kinase